MFSLSFFTLFYNLPFPINIWGVNNKRHIKQVCISHMILKIEKFSKDVQIKKYRFFFPLAESVELRCPGNHWLFKLKEKSVRDLVSLPPACNIEFGVCVCGGRYVLSLLDCSYFFPRVTRGEILQAFTQVILHTRKYSEFYDYILKHIHTYTNTHRVSSYGLFALVVATILHFQPKSRVSSF